jgi:TPR repeat protein
MSNKDSEHSTKMEIPEGMNLVDDAYLEKMAAFEVDCNDGKGEPAACHHVGEFYSVVKDQHARSAKIYEENCLKKGYGASCFNLGKLFLSGKGIEQSDKKAGSFFAMACNNDHLQGCYHQGVLAYLVADGKSEENQKDEAAQRRAIKLMEKNCEKGDVESCYFAASHFIKKDDPSIQRNPTKALGMLKKACEKNHGPSCFNLAVMYKTGDDGVKVDMDKHAEYKLKTEDLVQRYGGLSGRKAA